MKINFLKYILLIIIISFNYDLKKRNFFDPKNIKIEENGNMIYALNSVANIPDQKILIEGNKSIYNKLIPELTIIGDVKFFDNLNNVYIESEKAIYNDTTNTIITNGKTFIRVEDKYKVYSSNILYNRNTQKISSILDTKILDNFDNIYYLKEGFIFDKIKEIIFSKTTNIIDSEKTTIPLKSKNKSFNKRIGRKRGKSKLC